MNFIRFLFLATFCAGYVCSSPLEHIRRKRVSGNGYSAYLDDPIGNGDEDYVSDYDYNYETFSCADNRGKILLDLLCDDIVDCLDGSDEAAATCQEFDLLTSTSSASPTTETSSTTPQFSTKEVIIPVLSKVDDYGDYADCLEDEFQCLSDTSICLPKNQLCDGIDDCPEREDELGCSGSDPGSDSTSTIENTSSKSQQVPLVNISSSNICKMMDSYQCRSQPGDCVPNQLLCDGFRNCKDGSDEERCYCGIGNFSCLNGKCVDASYRCDGINDCGDFSDEILGCVVLLKNNEDEDETFVIEGTTQSSFTKTHKVTKIRNNTERSQTAVSAISMEYSTTSDGTGIVGKYTGICKLNPCANGGLCLESDSHFQCICQSKYTGPTCLQVVSQRGSDFNASKFTKISWIVIALSFLICMSYQ